MEGVSNVNALEWLESLDHAFTVRRTDSKPNNNFRQRFCIFSSGRQSKK